MAVIRVKAGPDSSWEPGRRDDNPWCVLFDNLEDSIGNVAVLFAALGVFGTGAIWPDVVVAMRHGGAWRQRGLDDHAPDRERAVSPSRCPHSGGIGD